MHDTYIATYVYTEWPEWAKKNKKKNVLFLFKNRPSESVECR